MTNISGAAQRPLTAAVIGGGPAGLMAADVLAHGGVKVTIYDRMPSVGRKFLMAGRGGLNITHSEPLASFLPRYGSARAPLARAIEAFSPQQVQDFCAMLGEPVFTGTSGRVFPRSHKTSPLLRAWLARLRAADVSFALRETFCGLSAGGKAQMIGSDGVAREIAADVVVLALGGASWPRLGADGAWVPVLAKNGIAISPLTPANCGLNIAWSPHLLERAEGEPLKTVIASFNGIRVAGDLVITKRGLEGGPVYALSGIIRDVLAGGERATLHLDLKPHLTRDEIATRLSVATGKQSWGTALRKRLALSPAALSVLREGDGAQINDAGRLAARIKALPLTIESVAGLERAISSAGGVQWGDIDPHFMLRAHPGIFIAGEMLDWEAPTGGYLLQACLSTGHAAGHGALEWIKTR